MALRLEKDECLCLGALAQARISRLGGSESSTNPTWGMSDFHWAMQIRQPQSIVLGVASASESKHQLASPNLFQFPVWRPESQTRLSEQRARFARIRGRHPPSSGLQQSQMESKRSW